MPIGAGPTCWSYGTEAGIVTGPTLTITTRRALSTMARADGAMAGAVWSTAGGGAEVATESCATTRIA